MCLSRDRLKPVQEDFVTYIEVCRSDKHARSTRETRGRVREQEAEKVVSDKELRDRN